MARNRTVKVTLVGDATSLSRAFGSASGAAGGLLGGLKKVAGIAGIGGLVIAAKRGVQAAVELSTGFETNLAKIVGLVGISRDQVNDWADDIKTLAPQVAKAPEELADALFFITSAGLRGSTAMDTLEVSAKAASAGLGETKEVAFAAVSAMNAYGAENLSASEAVDILTNTVRQGNVEASEVAGVLGKIIPVSAELGISFDQVGATIAAMTRLGADAGESVTNLQGIFRAIIKPSNQAQEILGQYGLSALGLRKQLKEEGLLSVLSTLSGVFADNEEAATKVFGRIQGLTGFLSLMGSNAETNVEIFKELANSTGTADEAFAAMEETAGFKLNQSLTRLKVIGTNIGDQIVPGIVNAVERFVPVLEEVLPQLGQTFEAVMDMATAGLPLLEAGMDAVAGASRGFTFVLDGLGDLFGATDGRLADFARASEFLAYELNAGKDPAAALANAVLDLARTGELTTDQWERLARQSGLTDDRLDDVRAALDEYARSGQDAAVTSAEVADALGLTEERADAAADADRKFQRATEDAGEASELTAEQIAEMAAQEKEQKAATDAARQALLDKQSALREIHDPMFRLVQLTGRLEDAERDVQKAEEEFGRDSSEYRDAVLERAGLNADLEATYQELKSSGIDPTGAAARTMFQGLGVPDDVIDAIFDQFNGIESNFERRTFEMNVSAPDIEYQERGGNRFQPVRKGRITLARGGIATGPTDALIGEGSDNEAVIPLNQRGIEFLAAALQRVLGDQPRRGGDLRQEFVIQGGDMSVQELAEELEFRRRVMGY